MFALLLTGCAASPAAHRPAVPLLLQSEAAKTVTLSWSYPPEAETVDLTFKLYHSLDLAAPLPQWPLLRTIPATERSVVLPAIQSQEFFIVTASNYLGESNFQTLNDQPVPDSTTHEH